MCSLTVLAPDLTVRVAPGLWLQSTLVSFPLKKDKIFGVIGLGGALYQDPVVAPGGGLIVLFSDTLRLQGVFPKPPDFSSLGAFDLSFFAGHLRFTLFLLTALALIGVVLFAALSPKVKAFWQRVRQGLTILGDRRRYLREVVSLQALSWLCRFAAFWFLLEAFGVGASAKNVLLVFAVNQVAGAVPFTPGGAGVQQALLVKVFAHNASTTVVAAYSVGQQIAIAAFTAACGLAAVVFIFRFRSFKEVIFAGRASREAEREAEAEGRRAGTLLAEEGPAEGLRPRGQPRGRGAGARY